MEEKEIVTNTRSKKIIFILLAVFILIGIMVCLFLINDNRNINYELETITDSLYFKLYEDEKYGVIDAKGNILVEPKYEMIVIPNPAKPVFICYINYNSENKENETEVVNEKNEKILTQYKQVLPLMFKDAYTETPYEKSVLAYKQNEKYGIIDFKGKRLTNAIYDSIESLLYKEGCLLVKQEDKYGVITMKGKQVIEVAYDDIIADGYYEEDTKYQKAGFIVRQKKEEGYRYGYINNKAEKILEVEYNEIDRVTEISQENTAYLLAFKNGQAGVYKNNKLIIKHGYEEIEYNKQTELFIVQKNDKQGVINKEGNEILPVEYDYILISGKNITAQKDNNTKYFDLKGNEEKNQNNKTTLDTENPNYFITINEAEKYGICSKDGNIILENEYSYIEYAYDTFFITTKEGKIEVIDAQNKEKKLLSSYQVVQKLDNKNIIQAIISEPYTIEIYNSKMEKIATMKEATLKEENSYIILSSNTQRKYFDNNGNEVKNTDIFPNLTLYAFNNENGKWGFKNKEGAIVIEPNYDMVTELNEKGFAGIKKDNKWGVVNEKGEIILQPIYEIEWNEPQFIGEYCRLNFGYGMVYYTKQI